MGIAAVEVGFRVRATTFEGALEGLNGLVIAFLLLQQRSHAIVCLGPLWLLGRSLFEVFQCRFGIALARQGNTEIEQDEGVIGVQRQGLVALLYRLIPAPLLAVNDTHAGMHGSLDACVLEQS